MFTNQRRASITKSAVGKKGINFNDLKKRGGRNADLDGFSDVSEEERVEVKLDLRKIEEQWDKFKKTEEQMNGVLNIKSIRARFADFR